MAELVQLDPSIVEFEKMKSFKIFDEDEVR